MYTVLKGLIGLLLLTLSAPALTEVVGVDPDQLEEMVAKQDALVIDVRTPQEWETTGIIPSSQKLMFFNEEGKSDSEKWLAKLNQLKKADQPVILVCHSGGRSSKVGHFLNDKIGMKNVYHLENGISGWKKEGKATVP